MYPNHAVTDIARSLCLTSDAHLAALRQHHTTNLRRFHPLRGSWAWFAYFCCLALALGGEAVPGLASSRSWAVAFGAFNFLAISGMLSLASRELVSELFLLESLPDGTVLEKLAEGDVVAQRFLQQLALLRSVRVVADLKSVLALRRPPP